MLGDHDDDGIDAREMFGAAPSARSRPARLERRGGAAAIGAEAVARMPIDQAARRGIGRRFAGAHPIERAEQRGRSEEHTSELQSLMRISYAVFCLKKKKQTKKHT